VDETLAALTRFCVGNNDLDELELILGEFNLFEAVGMRRQEIRHSRFLAFLLDPKGAHGLSDLFLTRFLQRAVRDASLTTFGLTAIELELMDLSDAQVFCELDSIDILVTSAANRLTVSIENKVGEHSNQLQRYLLKMERKVDGHRILPVFLSPQGAEPSESRYFPISYESVVEILNQALESRRANISADVLLVVQHYIRLLERHVVNDSKIQELCIQIVNKHRKALEILSEYLTDGRGAAKAFALSEFVSRGWKRTSGYLVPPGWEQVVSTGDRQLPLVTFWIDPKLKEITLIMEILPGEPRLRQRVFEIAKANPDVFTAKQKELSQKFGRILRYPLCDASLLEEESPEVWQARITQGIETFIDEKLPRITETFKNAPPEGLI
jgi:hypothetical protein